MEVLCLAWMSEERGILRGTASELSRMLGLSQSDFERLIAELEFTKTADVTRDNGIITVVSRRMIRDEKNRNSNAYRQAKHRTKNKNNGRMMDMSQMNNKDISSSSSYSDLSNKELVRSRFDKFWKLYPKKMGKKDALSAFVTLNPDGELFEIILTNIEGLKETKQWLGDNGQFIPLPANYLRDERWADEGTEKLSKRGKEWTN